MFMLGAPDPDADQPDELESELGVKTLDFAATHTHGEEGLRDVIVTRLVEVRYWEGRGHKAPIVVAHAKGVTLQPGSYEARFVLGAAIPRKMPSDA